MTQSTTKGVRHARITPSMWTLSLGAGRVLEVIDYLVPHGESAVVSLESIVGNARLSKAAVHRAIAELVTGEFITAERADIGNHTAWMLHVLFPKDEEAGS